MKFLCLCYYDTEAFAGLSPEECAAVGAACQPHDDRLKATGKVLAIGSLGGPETWHHFLPAGNRPQMKPGPYLPGQHQAGAFFLVEAASEAEALAVASRHPTANYGAELGFAVEVRPCERFETLSPHGGAA
jgi:hypothetical protein